MSNIWYEMSFHKYRTRTQQERLSYECEKELDINDNEYVDIYSDKNIRYEYVSRCDK